MTEPSAPQKVPSSAEANNNGNGHGHKSTAKSFPGEKVHFPNPPDPSIPDPETLREQWQYAKRQYSRWYGHAWGTAILAGVSFFALGWFIKGSNPLPSVGRKEDSPPSAADKSEEDRPASQCCVSKDKLFRNPFSV